MTEKSQAKRLQKNIKTRLRSLHEIADVSVDASENFSTIKISHKLRHVADFEFNWTDENHYVGYFVPPKGEKSQAIISLWSLLDTAKFVVLYNTLVELRSKREGPESSCLQK